MKAVIAALDRVVESETFAKAERPARFLRHLVETALNGDSQLLKESVLGTEVFERKASWDPRLDPVVRQEAARLRKRLAKYYENDGAGSAIRIELPVGSYVPVFQQVEREPVVQAPVRRNRAWGYAAAGLVCAAIAAAAWLAVSRGDHTISIAVLPFTSLNADPSNQYFLDGLTDEITDSLARLKSLRVIARSSAFQFKGKKVDLHEVGRVLKVGNVLEGSVERSGDRIKIVAHLERVSDGSMVWSNTYERRTSDMFAIESELAADIAGNLRVAAGAPGPVHTPNAEAHGWVLKARYDIQQMSTESVKRAEAEYRKALDLDPQYGAAYLGLALAKYDRFVAGGSVNQSESDRRSAEEFIHKALELDPGLPSAHAMLAALAMQYDWDWGRAERELKLAETVGSSSTTEAYYGFLLVFRGRFDEADIHLRRMVDLDPFSTATMNNLMVTRHLEGRPAEAREVAQRMAAQYPDMLAPQEAIGGTYIEEGRPELALPIFQKLEARFPQAKFFEAMAYARAGRREEALRLVHECEEKYANSQGTMEWFALVYGLLGDEESTVKWMERSADRHEFQAMTVGVNPVFAGMRDSKGFRALRKRMGLE